MTPIEQKLQAIEDKLNRIEAILKGADKAKTLLPRIKANHRQEIRNSILKKY